jgi:hypothetical protein
MPGSHCSLEMQKFDLSHPQDMPNLSIHLLMYLSVCMACGSRVWRNFEGNAELFHIYISLYLKVTAHIQLMIQIRKTCISLNYCNSRKIKYFVEYGKGKIVPVLN